MPINRKSQSRRAHVEKSKKRAGSKKFEKLAGESPTEVSAMKEELKKKRSGKKR